MRVRVALLVPVAVLFFGSAQAQDSRLTGCGDPKPDVRIAACTEYILKGGQGIKSELAKAYSNRGNGYVAKGLYVPAIRDFDMAISLDPDLGLAYNNRCYALAELERFDRALTDCDKALALLPGNGQVLDSRGYVYFRLGRFQDAIHDLDEALALFAIPSALYVRGAAKLKLGDAAGQADVKQAIGLDPTIAKSMAALGVVPQLFTEANAPIR